MFNLIKRLFGKAGNNYSLIVCSKCGSSKVSVTTCVGEEKDIIEGGISYDRFTYGVRCNSCGSIGVFTEKWENVNKDNPNERIYVTLVEDHTKCTCPSCGCKHLIHSSESNYQHKIDSSYDLYVCKKCGIPVCAVKKGDK